MKLKYEIFNVLNVKAEAKYQKSNMKMIKLRMREVMSRVQGLHHGGSV